MTPDRCQYHDGLVEGQATIATELSGINARLAKIETILTGRDGISGIVGWRNQVKGRAAFWGMLSGGMVSTVILLVRYLLERG